MDTLRRLFREVVLSNVFRTLAVVLGLTQVLIGHWLLVVFAGREGPGLALGLVLAAGLVAANVAVLPTLRRARQSGGWPRLVARGYMTLGLVTILVGVAVALAWAGALPIGWLLTALGVSPDDAFALFRFASVALVASIAGMIAWGFTGGQAFIRHDRVRVPLGGLHASHHGLRVLQLSDLHIGNRLGGRRLEKLVERANAEQPDLVAITGDIFDFDPAVVEDGARVLAGLRARLGVYAVLGNHDYYTGLERVADALRRNAPAIRVLRGDFARLDLPEPFYVGGLDDPANLTWTARDLHVPELDALAERLPRDGPTLLLVHRPELFPQAARLGFRLVLAGHTHGGQLAVPLLHRRLNLARIITRYDRGLFQENGSVLYVNRGVGVAGPALRVATPREISLLELGPA